MTWARCVDEWWGELTTVLVEANRAIHDFPGKLMRQNDGAEAALINDHRAIRDGLSGSLSRHSADKTVAGPLVLDAVTVQVSTPATEKKGTNVAISTTKAAIPGSN